MSGIRERRFLLACLPIPGHSSERISEHAGRVSDWDLVADVAQRYAISAWVHRSLRNAGCTVPNAVAVRLQEAAERVAVGLAIRRADLARIAAVTAGADLPVVVLKGGALAAVTEVRDRHTDDIDILVKEQDAASLAETLPEAGYAPLGQAWPSGHHPFRLFSAPGGSPIDVHVRLPGRLAADIWSRARPVDVAGHDLLVPAPADLLEHMCHHVLVHHAAQPRYLPRHLVDVAGLLDAYPNLDATSGPVQASRDLLAAAAALSPSRWSGDLLAAMVFPTHHTLVPSGGVARLRRHGRTAKPRPVHGLRKTARKLLFRVT